MKLLCLLAVGSLLALAVEAKKVGLKHQFKKLRHQIKAKQLEYLELCKNIVCKENEGCKVKHGIATCIRCRQCDDNVNKPVCGTNGKDYQSRCHLHNAACRQSKIGLIRVKCFGPCRDCGEGTREKARQHTKTLNKTPKTEQQQEQEESGHVTEAQLHKLRSEEAANLKQKKKYRKWKQWKEYRQAFKKYATTMGQVEPLVGENNCTKMDNDSLPHRMLDWFHVLRAEDIRIKYKKEHNEKLHKQLFNKMKLEEAKMPFPELSGHCREPINWMFNFLDLNQDGVLGEMEIDEIRKLSYERCITKFFDNCDRNKDNQFDLREFCECFPVEPPCLAELKSVPSLLQRGQVIAMPGFDLPECDEDGFYMPLQCHTNERKDGTDWCWCVDRNGGVVEGTYKKGYHECPDNTTAPEDEQEMEGEEEEETGDE